MSKISYYKIYLLCTFEYMNVMNIKDKFELREKLKQKMKVKICFFFHTSKVKKGNLMIFFFFFFFVLKIFNVLVYHLN